MDHLIIHLKLMKNVINCWSKILKKIKNSKLIIKCSNEKKKLDRIQKNYLKKKVFWTQ